MLPEARYRSDDRDLDGHDKDLLVFYGNNGDWYVSVVNHGEKIGPCVRVTTSGVPRGFEGVASAVIRLHAAMRGDHSREVFVCADCGYGVAADEDGCCATCGRDCAIVVPLVEPLDMAASGGSSRLTPAGGPADSTNADGLTPYRQSRADAGHCMSNRDGECDWARCPQNRDGEPGKTGRHCPRDTQEDEP